jgi:hypothetical protein
MGGGKRGSQGHFLCIVRPIQPMVCLSIDLHDTTMELHFVVMKYREFSTNSVVFSRHYSKVVSCHFDCYTCQNYDSDYACIGQVFKTKKANFINGEIIAYPFMCLSVCLLVGSFTYFLQHVVSPSTLLSIFSHLVCLPPTAIGHRMTTLHDKMSQDKLA